MTAYITIGLPASGKSTWAKQFISDNDNVARVNNDEIRESIYKNNGNNTWSPNIEERVKFVRENDIHVNYCLGIDTIVDNTHLNPKTLNQIITYCESLGYKTQIVDFRHVPLEECLLRDSQRENSVGEKVILDMYNKFMKEPKDKNPPSYNYNPDYKTCIIVDIDGTLAQMKDRGPYDEDKVYNDEVRKHVWYTIEGIISLSAFFEFNTDQQSIVDKVFIFTGRSENCREETERWLTDKCGWDMNYFNNIDKDHRFSLHMRKKDDKRRDSLVKMDMYNEHVKDKYNVFVVFDDRPQVIRECWKVLNLPVFNCGVIDQEF